MVFRAEKSRWESCDKFVYTSVGTEHSHWSVFDSCQNISIIAYLFYVSFVLEIAVGWTDVAFEGERILWWSRIQSICRLVHKLEAAPFHHSPNEDHPLAFLSMCFARFVCKYMRIYLSFIKSIIFVQVKLSAISRNPLYKSDFNSS